jgi:hypothetical protein
MKTYRAPELVERGNAVRNTEGMFIGKTDPDGISARTPVGSVGFGL